MANLEVQIGAEIEGLKKGIKEAANALGALEKSIEGSNNELKKLSVNSVKVDKSISDLNKAFNDGKVKQDFYARNLTRLQGLQSKYADNSKDLRKRLSDLKRSYKDLGGASSSASVGIGKMGKSTVNAVPSVTEFSRVIQDAPFGIQGVANNITQLTSQFGNLSKNAGGSTAALKAMLGTLSGPAGVLLIVSAVTSLMVSYGDKIANVIKGNDALAASQKKVKEALNSFYGDQVTRINTYVSRLTDVNIKEGERENVIKKLIGIVPSLKKADFEYGANLDLVRTKIAAYVLAQASRAEADALVEENRSKLARKARIDSINNIQDEKKRIEELKKFIISEGGSLQTVAIYTGNVKLNKSIAQLEKEFKQYSDTIDKEVKPIQDRIATLFSLENTNTEASTELEKLTIKQSELKEALEQSILLKGKAASETIALGNEYKIVTKQIEDLTAAVKGFEGASSSGGGSVSKPNKEAVKGIIDYNKRVEDARKLSLKIEADANADLLKEQEEFIDAYVRKYGKLGDELTGENFLEGSKINTIGNELVLEGKKIAQLTKQFEALSGLKIDLQSLDLSELNRFESKLNSSLALTDVFTNAVGNSFKSLTNNLTEQLQTGNAIFDTFVASVVNGLAELGIALLAQLVQQKVFGALKQKEDARQASSTAIKIGTETAGAAGPAGLALLPATIGTALGIVATSYAGINAFAKGGFSGDDNLAFLNKNELVLRPMEQATLFNALKGNALGSISNNSSKGGNNVVIADVVLRGSNQVIQYKRANKKMRKFGGK